MRFIAGGLVVLAFASLADVLRPKSFAGLFSAAPSVALATLALAFIKQGADYVAIEGRSMAIGALAFALFGFIACQLIMRFSWSSFAASATALLVWFIAALGIEQLLIG
ncbi:DUF3147 family protein [Bradyrhizobium sp. 157]|uniref:DUF3147 family protein n=1 Tax=Bradyrhizobium sp. 157 TaxID=2782631 RepID=UPI00320B250E